MAAVTLPNWVSPIFCLLWKNRQKNIIFYHNSQRANMRWGGSETGKMPYPCWGNYLYKYSHSNNKGKKLNLKLKKATTINAIILAENIAKGERVLKYAVERQVNGKWQVLNTGTRIGHKHIVELKPTTESTLRLKIHDAKAAPSIRDFSAYTY